MRSVASLLRVQVNHSTLENNFPPVSQLEHRSSGVSLPRRTQSGGHLDRLASAGRHFTARGMQSGSNYQLKPAGRRQHQNGRCGEMRQLTEVCCCRGCRNEFASWQITKLMMWQDEVNKTAHGLREDNHGRQDRTKGRQASHRRSTIDEITSNIHP